MLPRSGFDSVQRQKCLLMASLVVNDMPVRLQHTIAQILKPFVSEIGCRHGDYFIQTVSSSDGSFSVLTHRPITPLCVMAVCFDAFFFFFSMSALVFIQV